MDPISFYLQPKRATAATMPQVLSAAPHAPSKGCQSATKAARSRHSPLPPFDYASALIKSAVGRSVGRRPDGASFNRRDRNHNNHGIADATCPMADDENKERRAEELDALRSFYEDDLLSGDESSPSTWRIRIRENVTLEMLVPGKYPADDSPIPKLKAPGWALDEGRKADLLKELNEMIIPGTEMAIVWAEHLRAEIGDDDNVEEDGVGNDSSNYGNQQLPTRTGEAQAQNMIIVAVVEFHHMLIGPSHKKEAQALSAASSHGVVGQIFMGGPSFAVVKSMVKDDLAKWLQDCKKAGKPGTVTFWKEIAQGILPSDWPTKLKVVQYAGGKGEKPDLNSYKEALEKADIPFPLPPCSDFTTA